MIITNKKPKPPRIIIYGPAGIGKSTFGALAPEPVFIQTEDGLDAIEVPAFPLCKTYGEVLDHLGHLCAEDHGYTTLIVDSIDWLERLIWSQLCSEKNVKNLEDIPYGKGYVMVMDLWREYVNAINYLRDEKDMMVIQIGHSEIKRFENPETEGYDRYQIKLHKLASALLQEHSDIVLFANHQVTVKKTTTGFSERTRAIGSGERVLYSEERPAFVAKNRYGLPSEIPFDKAGNYWQVIASHVPYFNTTKGE